jgi:hypothetical protein
MMNRSKASLSRSQIESISAMMLGWPVDCPHRPFFGQNLTQIDDEHFDAITFTKTSK